MSDCNHDCSTCSQKCSDRKEFIEKQNVNSNVKKVIGIVSGKGGVGKSFVTSSLAVAMNNKCYKTAILDADITGPSIPKMFGITEKATSLDGKCLQTIDSAKGIKTMSVNYLLENDDDPVVWRGPVIAGTVKQFWTDVNWGEVDFMFVDMPPGTGDVPLTVFQSLPVSGIVIVSSPQELVSMIVKKAVKMASLMNIPIIGIVENMSYLECPDCKSKINIFGNSNIEEVAKNFSINTIAKIPLNPNNANLCDKGKIEEIDTSCFNDIVNEIEKI